MPWHQCTNLFVPESWVADMFYPRSTLYSNRGVRIQPDFLIPTHHAVRHKATIFLQPLSSKCTQNAKVPKFPSKQLSRQTFTKSLSHIQTTFAHNFLNHSRPLCYAVTTIKSKTLYSPLKPFLQKLKSHRAWNYSILWKLGTLSLEIP